MSDAAIQLPPLQWPQTGVPPPSESECRWKTVPLIGWFVAAHLARRREWSVAREFHAQIRRRPPTDPQTWGNDPVRQKVAASLADAIRKAGRWPNTHFLPGDPIDILWWEHDGWLEPCVIHFELEDSLGIKFSPPETFYQMDKMTFGEAVDHLVKLTAAARGVVSRGAAAPADSGDKGT